MACIWEEGGDFFLNSGMDIVGKVGASFSELWHEYAGKIRIYFSELWHEYGGKVGIYLSEL